MYYKNFFTRFVFRKNLLHRIKYRLKGHLRTISRNEYDDLKFLFDKCKIDPAFIIDGGANVGYVTYQFQKRFPSAKIFSFEPNPTVFENLKTSYEKDQNIITLNKGIGDTNGELQFNINKNTGVSSFLEPNSFHKANLARKALPSIKVPIVNLSDFLKEQNITQLDILKLDIEGYELKALQGLEEELEKDKVKVILTEFNLIPTYIEQPLIHHMIGFLENFEYSVYNIYGFHENIARQAIIGNIVFISKSFRKELSEVFGEKYFGW